MRRLARRPGPLAIGLLVAANTACWLAVPPTDDGREGFARQVVAEHLASQTVILFCVALVLATRARFLEPLFGGLDRVYEAHRRVALAGFVLLIAHVALVPWRLDFRAGGTPSGIIAGTGIATLVVLAAGPRLPGLRHAVTLGYRRWRWTHHLLGLFFLIAFAHTLLVDSVVSSAPPAFAILCTAYVVGAVAYLYSRSLARLIRPRHRYTVQAVRRLTASVVEVALRPAGRPMRFRSGQFAIVSFRQPRLREPHPFTISSAPGDTAVTFTIKAVGDHTARLVRDLEVGRRAIVEGGYGRFDRHRGASRQVWIAGGIGVTPFLSWLRDRPSGEPGRVDFFYAVRNRADAVGWSEMHALARRHPGVTVHLHVSAEAGALTAGRIAEVVDDHARRDYYLCGPPGMVRSLRRQLRSRGVPAASIRYERFHFR